MQAMDVAVESGHCEQGERPWTRAGVSESCARHCVAAARKEVFQRAFALRVLSRSALVPLAASYLFPPFWS